jgi:hypothetical protein
MKTVLLLKKYASEENTHAATALPHARGCAACPTKLFASLRRASHANAAMEMLGGKGWGKRTKDKAPAAQPTAKKQQARAAPAASRDGASGSGSGAATDGPAQGATQVRRRTNRPSTASTFRTYLAPPCPPALRRRY